MFSFRGAAAYFSRFFRGWNRTIDLIFRPVWRLIVFVFFAIWNWGRSRNWIYFLQGFPAFAASIAIVAIVGLRWSISSDDLQARYLDKAQSAFDSRDYPMAMVGYERIATMGQDRPENLFKMALAYEKMGQPVKTLKIMNQLAPADQLGYPLAHKWMALFHYRAFIESRQQDIRQKKLVETHLTQALKAGITDVDDIHGMLGKFYAKIGRADEAASHLARAVKTYPELRLLYAQVLNTQNNRSAALDQTKMAVAFFKTRSDNNPADKGARIDWALSLTFLEEFQHALDVLRDGFVLYGNDPDFRVQMANVCLEWQSAIARKEPENVGKQLELLQTGLDFDGTNVSLLNRLLVSFPKNAKEGEKARKTLYKVLASGEATPASHFLIGMDAWQLGDAKKALSHLSAAYKMNSNLPTVGNNLAFILAHSEQPDLPQALEIIEVVLKSNPMQPSFRETRGRIFMKMNKWEDAKLDLEYAVWVQRDFPGIHKNLAEVYSQLGETQIAEEHRLLHDESERNRPKTQPR